MKKSETKVAKFSNRLIIGSFSLVIILLIISILVGKYNPNYTVNFGEQVATLIITVIFLGLYIFSRHIFVDKFYYIPNQYFYIAMIFAYFSTYLGSYLNFYEAFSWWDDLLHFSSGILLGLLSIVIVSYAIGHRFAKYKTKSDILLLVVIGGLLSLSIAIFWEFYEFSYDYITDGNMQRGNIVDIENFKESDLEIRPSGRVVGGDLLDTMHDLFLASAGAGIAGIYAYGHFNVIQFKANKKSEEENEK